MITTAALSTKAPSPELESPTLWGLNPIQLHDRYWASQDVQVVRRGKPTPLDKHGIYLLTDPRTLTIFEFRQIAPQSFLYKPTTCLVRLHDSRPHLYKEMIVSDEYDRFVKLKRLYSGVEPHAVRIALTNDVAIAQLWQSALDTFTAWRLIRRSAARPKHTIATLSAPIYKCDDENDMLHLTRDLVSVWKTPGDTIENIDQLEPGVWGKEGTRIENGAILLAPVWVGNQRHLDPHAVVAGPAVLWDAPAEPVDIKVAHVDIHAVEEANTWHLPTRPSQPGKRLFDIMFAIFVLAITLPFYPLLLLAIWLEDGRPFFFVHRRETLGGREFPCLKFRSMRKNAEAVKATLVAANRADGPQFFLHDDPRLTRIGRFIRDTNIDELPQFWNVLLGHMSVVGPRPSPRKENQYCPPWREARLSVRPGIVGLWQICRSRAPGLDFQEWIRFDIEYTEKRSWRLDLWIIWWSVLLLLLRRKPKVEATNNG